MKTTRRYGRGTRTEEERQAEVATEQRLAAIRQAQAEEGQAMHNAAREAAKAEKVKLNRLTCRTDAPAWYATQVGRTVELRVAEADACPKCRERNVDNLVWDDGKVKCTTCGKQYTPPSK